MIPGLSYGAYTGSLAYPLRYRSHQVPNLAAIEVVLEFVHPGNLGPLPPSPSMLAFKGEQIGLGKYAEFFTTIWY